jgi:hypothetical protein
MFGPAGSCVRVTLTWTVAGGIACGGVLVGTLTLSGAVSLGFQLLAAPVLFTLGAALGFAHGCVLAVIGRPLSVSRRRALLRGLGGGALALPLVAAGWVVTAGMSLTAALLDEFRWATLLLCAGAWCFGLALCVWAGVEGVRALQRALERWPERRLGSMITGSILVLVSGLLVSHPPELAGTSVRVTGFGAFALAAVITLWVALPLVVLVLRLASARSLFHPGGR